MRIVVCVKPVPHAPRLIDATGRLAREGAARMNGNDENAVEAALQVRDRIEGAEVVLVTLAPADSADALRPGLAMGADRAVVISGPEFEGSDLLGTSYALAEVIRGESADLVVFGASSSDGNGAMLWAAVAERLDLPVISRAVDYAVEDGVLTATRQMEQGLDVIEVRLPAVLALSGDVNTPRYPSFKDVIAAKKRPVVVVAAGDGLAIDVARVGVAGARTTVRAITEPSRRGAAAVIVDDGSAADQVLDFLRDRNLIA